MTKHINNGNCPKCTEIIHTYPGFNQALLSWWLMFQAKHPEAHVSEAGRGYVNQERDFHKGASKAHYGESSHNYNCAIDTFVMLPDSQDIYNKNWYETILAPAVPAFLSWYGVKGAPFFELPHVELRDWKKQRAAGLICLVEPLPPARVA